MAPLSSHFVSSSVNKFYAIGNKIIVNASVFLDSSPETQSVTVRPTLQRQLSNIIQQRNNNLGISRLWVEGPNPIPVILGNLKLLNLKCVYVPPIINVLISNYLFAHRFERMRCS
jgi:hypothetical protein